MDWDEYAHWGKKIADWSAEYHKGIRDLPVRAQTSYGEIAAQLPKAPPEKGEKMEAIMHDFEDIVMPGITHWQHPRFFCVFQFQCGCALNARRAFSHDNCCTMYALANFARSD